MSEYSQAQKDLKDEEHVQIDKTDLVPLDQFIPEHVRMLRPDVVIERGKHDQLMILGGDQKPFDNKGVVTFIDQKNSDSQLNCVIQCLMAFEPFVQYYMHRLFNDHFPKKKRKLTKLLKEVFRDAHSIEDLSSQIEI